jgi:hypothetical protein
MMTVNTNEKNKRDGDYISEMFTASCGGGIVFLYLSRHPCFDGLNFLGCE